VNVRTFRLPSSQASEARGLFPNLIHAVDGAFVVSGKTADVLGRRVKSLRKLEPFELDTARWAETKKRLHVVFAAVVSEQFPEDVGVEARLMLYADPGLQLEFMGRGRVGSNAHLPAPKNELVMLDIAGGQRVYMFRRLQSVKGERDARMARMATTFMNWAEWVHDPGARVVVSLGGGGFRLFAAISAMKTVDLVLTDRTMVAEVWGSSGGAFLGYLFSAGIPLTGVEQFAFDLYNGRVPHLVSGSLPSIVRSRVTSSVNALRGRETQNETVGWLEELEKRHPPSTRRLARPFYAIASSSDRVGLTALGAPEHLVETCKDFMVGCHPHFAVAASTAVPFMIRPLRGIGENADERWFDGSISDENPLALPYVKWVRDRARDPAGTPPRLKIVLVSLNLRSSESGIVRAAGALPFMKRLGLVDKGSRIVDQLLDSKTTTNIRILTSMPGVEVLECKLNLGWLSAFGTRDIARAVRSGRAFEAWEHTMHRGPAMGTTNAGVEEPAPTGARASSLPS
jgi:hypothetical protein